jgi:hypothetical protein
MVLNSCVGSQVPERKPRELNPRIAMLMFAVQVLNLVLGVGLPCFISAAVSGQGGSIQVSILVFGLPRPTHALTRSLMAAPCLSLPL